MSIDAHAFRHTVGQFVTGVTVVAAEVHGAVRAMTANSFTSVSLDPPLVLFCVGKTAHLGQIIHDLFIYYTPGVLPPTDEELIAQVEG